MRCHNFRVWVFLGSPCMCTKVTVRQAALLTFTEFLVPRQWSKWLEGWCLSCHCSDLCEPLSTAYTKHSRHYSLYWLATSKLALSIAQIYLNGERMDSVHLSVCPRRLESKGEFYSSKLQRGEYWFFPPYTLRARAFCICSAKSAYSIYFLLIRF